MALQCVVAMRFCVGLPTIQSIQYSTSLQCYSWLVIVSVSSDTATSEDLAHVVCGFTLAVARRWMANTFVGRCLSTKSFNMPIAGFGIGIQMYAGFHLEIFLLGVEWGVALSHPANH